MALRRAFREEVVAEPAAAEMGEQVRPGDMLNYARPPRKMSLGRRWPVIHAILGVGVLVVMAIPLAILSLVEIALLRGALGIALPCGVALFAVLVASVVVAVRGLRDAGGRPAAATWRHAGRAVLCWMGLMVVTWGLLDWRVQRMMDESLARADLLGKEIEIISEDGALAASLYTKAGVLPSGTIQFDGDWELVDVNGRMTPPPEFPEGEAFRIPLLREAASKKTSGLVPRASSYQINTLLPHLSGMRRACKVLRQHAISESRAGRITSAIDDINAIHGMGDHALQGLTLVEMLVGTGLHGLADDTLQEVLPTVTDPRDLDRIRMDAATECMKASRRAGIMGELGVFTRRTAVMALRQEVDLVSPAITRNSSPLLLIVPMYRVLLGDRDIIAMEEWFATASEMVSDDPAETAGRLPILTALSVRDRWRTPLRAILMPNLSRAVGKSIEAAAMASISHGAVAATRFRIQKERLPTSWDELVQAKLIPAVPVDPFDGKPMRFAAHDGFLFIYTIGADRIDNGGVPFIVGAGGFVKQSNVGMVIADRPLWEMDLLPKGFVPATQQAE